MSLVLTCRGTVFSTTAAASYATTQTPTPLPGSLLIACVTNSLASTPLDPTTFTGHGVTWTQLVLGTRLLSTTHTMSIWVATAGLTPSSAAATAGFNAINQTGCAIIEYEISGVNWTVAANAVVLAMSTTAASGTTGTLTYAAPKHPANAQLTFTLHLANEVTSPRTGWTEDVTVVSDGSYNAPATGLEGQYRNDRTWETTSTATWTTSAFWLMQGIEIVGSLMPNLNNYMGFDCVSAGILSIGGDKIR